MTQLYAGETAKMLSDFLDALSRREEVDRGLLAALRQMMATGQLDDQRRIKSAIVALEEAAYELQDR